MILAVHTAKFDQFAIITITITISIASKSKNSKAFDLSEKNSAKTRVLKYIQKLSKKK